jgi:hypothetical protein
MTTGEDRPPMRLGNPGVGERTPKRKSLGTTITHGTVAWRYSGRSKEVAMKGVGLAGQGSGSTMTVYPSGLP